MQAVEARLYILNLRNTDEPFRQQKALLLSHQGFFESSIGPYFHGFPLIPPTGWEWLRRQTQHPLLARFQSVLTWQKFACSLQEQPSRRIARL